MKNITFDKIFKERIAESNIFTEKEKNQIEENYLLYKKCYCLGIIDATYVFDNDFFDSCSNR